MKIDIAILESSFRHHLLDLELRHFGNIDNSVVKLRLLPPQSLARVISGVAILQLLKIQISG